MLALLHRLRRDECGLVQTAELVLISTIVVIGLVVGLSEVAGNVNSELRDVGEAFNHASQGYNANNDSPQYDLDTCG